MSDVCSSSPPPTDGAWQKSTDSRPLVHNRHTPSATPSRLNYPFAMSSKHANARPSGEKEIKDTAIYTLMFMLIASKYAMNVLVSSNTDAAKHQNASLTVLGLMMWATPHCKHKEPLFKRQCNASGIEEKMTLTAKCTKYSIACVQSAGPLHSCRLLGHTPV